MPNRPRTHSARRQAEQRRIHDLARGSSAARGYGSRWRRLRPHVLKRDRYMCRTCGAPVGESGHVDHIKPRAQGGTDDESNLQTLCDACHSRKTAIEDGGFGRERGRGKSTVSHAATLAGGGPSDP